LTAFCGEEADPWFEANWEWQKGIWFTAKGLSNERLPDVRTQN
jgi:hypothetical protein